MDTAGLQRKLESIEGRGYKAYRQLRGAYSFPRFTLHVDYVQGDPFAAPSRLRARVPQAEAGFDADLFSNPSRRVALEDYLARAFDKAITRHVKGRRGTGKSGLVNIDSGGQEILERTAAVVNMEYVEVRFAVGLPARGRRCLGREALEILAGEVPRLVDDSLLLRSLDRDGLREHVATAEDQDWLRSRLESMGLAAFVVDGAILPRQSGIDDRPLSPGGVIRFRSPGELGVEVQLPNRGRVRGMGVPEGLTLVVGGGYHGKSTLLKAMERGVYNHVPGDGREGVVTRED
ncbi:MAG TPA: ATPase, partial [Actinobacteria bacterium]|nr:ATPase [Actinomycetota bacterium]